MSFHPTRQAGQRPARPALRWLRVLFVLAVFILPACTPIQVNPNVITGIAVNGEVWRPNARCNPTDGNHQPNCTLEEAQAEQFVPMDTQISILPVGSGNCNTVQVDFGDGTTPVVLSNQVLDNASFQVFHTYTGWPGIKTVRVTGLVGCYGDVTRDVTVGIGEQGRPSFVMAYYATTGNVCDAVPNVPSLRQGTGVRITVDDALIDYGLPQFNASGDLSTVASPDFPFPGFRPYSLIYKVGATQFIQGGVGDVVFQAAETAPLEICVNDGADFLFDNASSGLRIEITVNERSAGQ